MRSENKNIRNGKKVIKDVIKKIRGSTHEGASMILWGMILITFMMSIMIFTIALKSIDAKKEITEDAMTSACLAGTIIDYDQLAINGYRILKINSEDRPERSYNAFVNAFGSQLNLTAGTSSSGTYDGSFVGDADSAIFDFSETDGIQKKIQIEEYIIYNVYEKDMDNGEKLYYGYIYRWTPETGWQYPAGSADLSDTTDKTIFLEVGKDGSSKTYITKTPDGDRIDESGVYVRLSVPLRTFLGISGTSEKTHFTSFTDVYNG